MRNKRLSQMHAPHMGLRVLQAVIHYLHDYIPFGHSKEVITTITLEASTRDVKRELSRFPNKMTPTDNRRLLLHHSHMSSCIHKSERWREARVKKLE